MDQHWCTSRKEELLRMQRRRLRKLLQKQVFPYSAYYKQLFAEHGLRTNDILTLKDFEKVPFTSKKDLLSSPEHPNRARDFVIIPDQEKLKRRPSVILRVLIHGREETRQKLAYEFRPVFLTSTSGRSAQSLPFLYTRHDIDNMALSGYRLVDVLGANEEDRIMNAFPYAPHLAFWQTFYATKAWGVFSLPTGGGKTMGTDGNIRIMKSITPSVLIGMPTFLYHLLSIAVAEGYKNEKLRTLVLGGEKVPDGMRLKLKEIVHEISGSTPNVLATYGFTEARMAWAECPYPHDQKSGGYHLSPDLGYVEIIDPETGEVLPDETPGEIVYTPLNARGSVVLRYRTGDLIDGGLTYAPCPWCGRRMPRLVGNISRRSEFRELQFEKVKGTMVNFNVLEHVLDDEPRLGAWQLEIRKKNNNPHNLDELVLHAEKRCDVEDQILIDDINKKFKKATELKLNEVIFHSVENMRKLQGVGKQLKEDRIVDNRG